MKDDKLVTIYVESKPFDWPKNGEISHEQVVKFEVPDYVPRGGITYSVMFERGHGEKPEGTLAEGTSMKVKDGIRFTVSDTGQS
jgi:hypothetical protein